MPIWAEDERVMTPSSNPEPSALSSDWQSTFTPLSHPAAVHCRGEPDLAAHKLEAGLSLPQSPHSPLTCCLQRGISTPAHVSVDKEQRGLDDELSFSPYHSPVKPRLFPSPLYR